MSGGEQGVQQLVRALETASDEKLFAVVAMLDRLASRGALDAVLDPLRPRLAVVRPPRPLTLRRVLTLPLEPALVATAAWKDGSYRIPRLHLADLHRTVLTALPQETVQRLEARFAGATSRDAQIVLETGRELWPAAAAILEQVSGQHRLMDAHRRISFRLAAHLLSLGEWLVPAIWQLPSKLVVELEPCLERSFGELLGRAAERGREAFMLIAELLADACESPISILRLALEHPSPLPLRERAQCLTAIVDNILGELTCAIAEADAARVKEPMACARLVLRVVGIVESLQQAPRELRIDHYTVRRLLAATAASAERTVVTLLEGPLLAYFVEADADSAGTRSEFAEEAARAISHIRLVARQLGLVSRLDYVFRRSEREFLQAFDEFVARRRALQGELLLVDLTVMDRIRILEILFGSGKAVETWRAYRAKAQLRDERVVAE